MDMALMVEAQVRSYLMYLTMMMMMVMMMMMMMWMMCVCVYNTMYYA